MARKTPPKSDPEIPRSINPEIAIQLLNKQIEKARELLSKRPLSSSDHTAWNNTTRDYLIKSFGSLSPNVNAVLHASSDHGLRMGMGPADYERYEASRIENQIKMIDSCIEQLQTEITLAGQSSLAQETSFVDETYSDKVFVVHGHNHGAKEAVARFIEKLGLTAIILHEMPNKGRTIIEKFSDYADVRFAIVLLTFDDLGKDKDSQGEYNPRSRQNVIFEFGYFIGKLGRARVCALYENGVEIPTDYSGVLFIQFDGQDRWKYDVVRELLAAGFNVDANKIFSAD